jgi:subtilase family serine protease
VNEVALRAFEKKIPDRPVKNFHGRSTMKNFTVPFRFALRQLVLTSGKSLILVVTIFLATAMQSKAQSILTSHVRETVRDGRAKSTGRLPLDQVMNLDVVLPLGDSPGLDKLLRDLYDPASASYRHFLTVPEFTGKFGPTQAQYDALENFATTNGLTVTGGSRDGMDLQIKGTVSQVEAAFHVRMLTYQHPTEERIFYSPDVEPSVDLPFDLWHISGLDNYTIPHPLMAKRSDYAKEHGIGVDSVVPHALTGSGPSGAFLGSDMRTAYYGGTALTGAGQNLGLLEFGGTNLADLNTYFANIHQTNRVQVSLISADKTSVSCLTCDDGEQNLDMTQALGMAPGLSSLTMYIGSLDTAILSAMTTHNPLPTTIGCSWWWEPADPGVLDPYFKKMAAQGQSFFAASQDEATWTSTTHAWPAEDAWVTGVGGTDLVTDSRGEWAFETAWSESGGGVSPDKIAIPSWQQIPGVIDSSNMGSTIYRNGPDVAANANYDFYTCSHVYGCQGDWGGTSFAAPMWAAYVALINQQLASQSLGPVGFLNPTLYASNVKPGYSIKFHDITSGIAGSYSAETGYDLVTGWGSPKSGSLLFTYVPYTLFDPAEVALQEVEKAGLVPSFRGAGLKGSYVRTQAPVPGTIAVPGSTVTMVLVKGPTP